MPDFPTPKYLKISITYLNFPADISSLIEKKVNLVQNAVACCNRSSYPDVQLTCVPVVNKNRMPYPEGKYLNFASVEFAADARRRV
jgi:hypothetical protein